MNFWFALTDSIFLGFTKVTKKTCLRSGKRSLLDIGLCMYVDWLS